MKIKINLDKTLDEILVTINCKEQNQDVENILSALRSVNRQISVKQNDEVVLLNIENIFYIESVDRKTFVYTCDQVYETEYKLYEIENIFEQFNFIRVSKNTIICLNKIKKLKSEVDRKIKIIMENDYVIIASRMYADNLRHKLGLKK